MCKAESHRLFSNDEFAQRKAVQFSSFLKILLEACEYSSDLMISPWEFSVDFGQARMMGINLNDLRWMIHRGWIQCQRGGEVSDSEVVANEAHNSSTFIILNLGIEALRSAQDGHVGMVPLQSFKVAQSAGPRLPLETSKPFWNIERRELSILGTVVKRFRWPAPNQETILCVFAEEGWPSRIEDPLPQGNGLDPKRRLGDTIKCLNRNQNANLIRFRGDGTGEGVLWDTCDHQTG